MNKAMDCGAIGIAMSVMGVEGNTHVDFDGSPMPTDVMHDDDVVEAGPWPGWARRRSGPTALGKMGLHGNKEVSATKGCTHGER